MIYSFADFIKQWLEKAKHDLISASILIEHNPIVLDNACFHCQQAVEKYLKAFLIYKHQEISKTHDISFLLAECSNFDLDFTTIDTKNIQDFAVKLRYPHDSLSPDLEEAKQYYEIAVNIGRIVLNKIKF